MTDSKPELIKAADIAKISEFEFHHPFNANSEVYLRSLSRTTGLQRIAVTLARIPPQKESFTYHAHCNEEEWIYILEGRGIAEIGEEEYEVEAGDFMGFGLPQQPHHLRNPFDEELVYLMGGECAPFDMGIFPRHGKRVIREGDKAYTVEESALRDFWQS